MDILLYILSGIRELDTVQENLRHYVDNELFKGKKRPAKTDRRFYLTDRAVRCRLDDIPSIYNRPSEEALTASYFKNPPSHLRSLK